MVQWVKNLPAMLETQVRKIQVRSPGQEDPLEEENGHPLQYLAWKIPWTEETDGVQSKGAQRVGHNWVTTCSWYLY